MVVTVVKKFFKSASFVVSCCFGTDLFPCQWPLNCQIYIYIKLRQNFLSKQSFLISNSIAGKKGKVKQRTIVISLKNEECYHHWVREYETINFKKTHSD